MPPKPKFTKDEIVSAALEVARKDGINAVSAREVGKYLGTSSSPVFSAFKNMDELLDEVYSAALNEYSEYISDSVNYVPVFKQFGFRLIQFAKSEPNLFKIIFEKPHTDIKYNDVVLSIPAADICIESIMKQEKLGYEQSRLVFEDVLLTGFGICSMVSSNCCVIDDSDLDTYLGIAYKGSVLAVKTLNKVDYSVHPTKNKA